MLHGTRWLISYVCGAVSWQKCRSDQVLRWQGIYTDIKDREFWPDKQNGIGRGPQGPDMVHKTPAKSCVIVMIFIASLIVSKVGPNLWK